jgi:hypothetical protein
MREDGYVMSKCPAHDAKASTSRASPPASDVAISQPKQGLHRPGVPHALLDKTQAEQALWLEFCDHGASINNTLTEALQLHGGPSFRLFEVSVFRLI